MLAELSTFDISYRAELFRSTETQVQNLSHLSFENLTSNVTDMRDLLSLQSSDLIAPKDVIVDSDITLQEAFGGLSIECPDEILAHQELFPVYYFGEDNRLHRGQVVVHRALMNDVADLFQFILEQKVPVKSMIPISEKQFREEGSWSDAKSMEVNNGSSFNFRQIINATGVKQRLSLHALGLALDINPAWNPCFGDPTIHGEDQGGTEFAAGYGAFVPPNGTYDLTNPGAFHSRHPVVMFLKERGWTWGGDWAEPKDLHHFQKIPSELQDWTARMRS